MFSYNDSSNVATPISDLSNESLIIPEEIDFLREFVPGIKNGSAIIQCRYCQSQWASLNITHKKAHLSSLKNLSPNWGWGIFSKPQFFTPQKA